MYKMERIIDISYNKKLSHIGSSLMTYPILEHIYSIKSPNDVVVLSCGHAGMAQYVIIEKISGIDAEYLHDKHGTHPHRDTNDGIHVSSGSLGCAILVAVGMALGDNSKHIHCIISDGECAEGSVWEALAFIQINKLTNISVHANINGYGAYQDINVDYLQSRLLSFLPSINIWNTRAPSLEFMEGLRSHYHIIKSSDEKEQLITSLKNEIFAIKRI